MGTVPAALTTYAAVQAFQPDLILNAGTAGGFRSKGSQICDVYVASGVAFHDRRIFIPGTQYDAYGVGKDSTMETPKLLESTGWKSGWFRLAILSTTCPRMTSAW